MRFIRVSQLLAGIVCLLGPLANLRGENRFFVPPTEIRGLASGEEIFIHMDNDVELTALSFSIQFDPNVLQVVSIEPAGVTVSPEWESGGQGPPQVNNVTGELIYGIATEFDFGDPPDNLMAIGTDQRVARIVVDTLADSRTSTVLNFLDGLGSTILGSRNVMIDTVGDSLTPVLVDSGIAVDPFFPLLNSFQDNSGSSGTSFTIIGRHFEKPGLQVTVCGNSASVSVTPGGFSMTVIAPTCLSAGAAVVEVCNDFGCESAADGFIYEEIDFLRSDVDGNGSAGINDAILIARYAFRAEGLSTCEDAADVNDDGSVDLIDVMRLLFFLFNGGPPPSVPHPLPGRDPTPDALGVCGL